MLAKNPSPRRGRSRSRSPDQNRNPDPGPDAAEARIARTCIRYFNDRFRYPSALRDSGTHPLLDAWTLDAIEAAMERWPGGQQAWVDFHMPYLYVESGRPAVDVLQSVEFLTKSRYHICYVRAATPPRTHVRKFVEVFLEDARRELQRPVQALTPEDVRYVMLKVGGSVPAYVLDHNFGRGLSALEDDDADVRMPVRILEDDALCRRVVELVEEHAEGH